MLLFFGKGEGEIFPPSDGWLRTSSVWAAAGVCCLLLQLACCCCCSSSCCCCCLLLLAAACCCLLLLAAACCCLLLLAAACLLLLLLRYLIASDPYQRSYHSLNDRESARTLLQITCAKGASPCLCILCLNSQVNFDMARPPSDNFAEVAVFETKRLHMKHKIFIFLCRPQFLPLNTRLSALASAKLLRGTTESQ